ncbi:Xanthine phosphoribosyltransferase 1, partial [Haplosporangium bisporale]
QLDFSTPPPPTSTPSSNFSTTPDKNNTNTNTTKDIKYDLSKALAIDTVYTWVNGSDPQLQAVKKQYQDASSFFQTSPPRGRNSRGRNRGDQTANRFRDMDELKYSIRSLYENGRELGGKIHVLTTDIDPQSSGTGQVPSWLDLDAAKGNLTLVHHASIFEDSTALPTFNSLAIESQIHHVPNLTDVFMYLNDDVFLGTRTLPADIWTPLYGFVFHMEPSLLVPPTILPMPTGTVAVGEWHSLQYTNFLLSNQFGPRHRSYLAHVPHVLSAPMLQEIQNIWPDAFYGTSTHRFRGEGLSSEILPVDSTSGAYKTVIADLAKYNYVVATSQYSFIQLQTPQTAARDLDRILSHRYYEAFFCINDNVSGDDSQAERQVREIFHAFLEDRFSTPSPLEKNT